MSEFSSKYQFNNDPFPIVHPSGKRTEILSLYSEFLPGEAGPFGIIARATYDPRPEYNTPQTNPTNPILVKVRDDIRENQITLEDAAMYYSRPGAVPVNAEWWYTEEHLAHARKVLTRTVRVFAEDTNLHIDTCTPLEERADTAWYANITEAPARHQDEDFGGNVAGDRPRERERTMSHRMATCAYCDGPIYDTDDATGIDLDGPMHMDCFIEKYDATNREIRHKGGTDADR